MDTIIWLKPQVVAEVAFTEWTRDAHRRHAQFVNIRIRQASARCAARRVSTGGSFLDDSPALARRRHLHG
jgi:ATP-dependent DNA ligase